MSKRKVIGIGVGLMMIGFMVGICMTMFIVKTNPKKEYEERHTWYARQILKNITEV